VLCSSLVGAKFCHVCGQRIEKEEKPSVSVTSGSSTLSSTSSTSSTPVTKSRSAPVSFNEYQKRKEEERKSRFKPKAKKTKVESNGNKKTPSEVTINIGLRKFRDSDLKFVRGSSLPLTVNPSISADELLKKASDKILRFNSELTCGLRGLTLLYPDRTKVICLPGSQEPFTLEKYKEDIGNAYTRLTFHVCKTEDYLEYLCMPLYRSDSDPDFDKVCIVLYCIIIKY
jgi:hypothetical protein